MQRESEGEVPQSKSAAEPEGRDPGLLPLNCAV